MIFGINHTDLFNAPEHYYFAHCISADFALGAGIATEFNKRFNMRHELHTQYPNFTYTAGTCLPVGRVFNLVTKPHYYDKPTYESLTQALTALKQVIITNDIRFLAIPTLGCGLDRLNWDRVSALIQHIFQNLDVKIVVCIK